MRHQRRELSHENERQLRAGQTDAERLVWNMVRNRNLDGFKFRRQHRIGDYILDFYCAELRLGIELDGEAHFSGLGKVTDEMRTDRLGQHGIVIIRFENKLVIANPGIVSDAVRRFADRVRE